MVVKAGSAVVAILLSLAGCGGIIEQNVKPVTFAAGESREVCLIENPAVSEGFLDAYKSALSKRNLTIRMLPQGSALTACPLTLTYTANWRWDLALYLAYANLKVYRNGNLDGEALYDGMKAALDTGKFIKADAKIQELTDRLFPN
jgi:hypothetical protein